MDGDPKGGGKPRRFSVAGAPPAPPAAATGKSGSAGKDTDEYAQDRQRRQSIKGKGTQMQQVSLEGTYQLSDQPASTHDDDDEESDPTLVAKREQAALKSALAAGVEQANKKAANKLALQQSKKRLQWTTIFIFTLLVSLVGAIHVYIINNDIGPPPTQDASAAATSLVPVLIVSAILAMAAFVILYLKLSSLILAFTWMTLVVLLEYANCIILAKAGVTIHSATFQDILEYCKAHYLHQQSIPQYIDNYETREQCCGWGDPNRKFAAWPDVLETNDLPDSCCKIRFYGCGKSAVARGVPSGYVMALSDDEYVDFLSENRGQLETSLWTEENNELSEMLRLFPPSRGIPDELLRLVDEIRDTPMYYYIGEEVVQDDRTRQESITYIYKSFGQAENYRLSETIKEKVCDTDEILHETKTHTFYILVYATIILILCWIEVMVFWYYLVEERAERLAKKRQPGEFFMLQMENIEIDDRYNAILRERTRLDKIQNARQQEKEERLARDKLLADLEAEAEAEHSEQSKADNTLRKKKEKHVIRRRQVKPA